MPKTAGRDPELAAFAAVALRPPGAFDLAHATLVLARLAYPDLDVPQYLRRFDDLAQTASAQLPTGSARATTLARVLFTEMGFRGNTANYTDPRNSFLNDVLDRRLGIPITLSVLYVEVARRLRIPADGVGLPGHFVVRVIREGRPIYLDPFHGGIEISEDQCRQRVAESTQGAMSLSADHLAPVDGRYILTRMLNNLKNNYARMGDYPRAIQVVQRLRLLNPDDAAEQRNLGLLLAQAGRHAEAIGLLEAYLRAEPDAPDADAIRTYLSQRIAQISRWN
jgi:regulator of sirC expression with transglutaminase-like and TPR domain